MDPRPRTREVHLRESRYGSVEGSTVGADMLNAYMINYTEHIRRLMSDIVLRVPRLSFLDMDRVLHGPNTAR